MFGSPSEPFLAHVITRPPDFDQVTAIEIAAPSSDWLAGWEGVGITLKIDGTDRSPDTALREGDQVSATRLDDLATGSAVLDGAAGILSGDGRSRILAPYRF
jgi:hypothetical protein